MSTTENTVCCRSCLSTSSARFYSIQEEIPESNLNILQMLEICSLKVLENDLIPDTMCVQCFVTLGTMVDFIQRYELSQKILSVQSEQVEIKPEFEEEYLLECYEPFDEESIEGNLDEDKPSSSNTAADTIEKKTRKRRKYDPEVFRIPCPCCNHPTSKYKLLAHMMKVHPNHQDTTCKCHICDLELTTIPSYICHHVTYHNHLPKRHPCEYPNCNRSFSMEQYLKVHIRDVHSENPTMHQCNQCNESFINYGRLRYHKIKAHRGARYLCPHCGNAYLQLQHLKDHMWVHKGRANFFCDQCESTFRNYKSLRQHLLRYHSPKSPDNGKTLRRRNKKTKENPATISTKEVEFSS